MPEPLRLPLPSPASDATAAAAAPDRPTPVAAFPPPPAAERHGGAPLPDVDGQAVPDRLVAGLNPEQETAVRCLTGPLLVVAGPGSGKTRVLTHRLAALIDQGVPPWRILAVTFTNKAANEMRDRLADLVGADAVRPAWVATFHAACVRILRANHDAAGLARTFLIVDVDDARKLTADALQAAGVVDVDRKLARQWHQRISNAKNRGLRPVDLADSPRPSDRELADVYARYQAELAKVDGVDFDDLLLRTCDLLEHRDDIADRYRDKFAYVMVDEFQDTNPVQYRIVQLLASHRRNLMVVGDLDQSIYAFRSATPQLMAGFEEDWPGTTVVTLDRNYRSTAAILETVRAIIAPNPSPHRPALTTDNPAGAPVRLYHAADDRDEARWVVAQIRDDRRAGGDLADHAVLFRTHAQTRVFEDALRDAGLPYDVVGAQRFYDRAEIKDALAYLRAAVNRTDRLAFSRAVTTPKRGIGPKTLEQLEADAAVHGGDLVATARAAAADGGARTAPLGGFADLLDRIAVTAAADGPAAALELLIDASGLRDQVRKDRSGIDREGNLDELVATARDFVAGDAVTADGHAVASLDPAARTIAYLENVALVSSSDTDTSASRVQLVTAHASKGKEWPHVWVAGVADGMYPHTRSTAPAEIAEERRLLFVACSRAEQTLTVSYPAQRWRFAKGGGKVEPCRPSPFLSALPSSVVDVEPATQRGRAGRSDGGHRRARQGQPRRPFTPPAGTSFSRSPRPSRPEPNVGDRLTADDLYEGQIVKHAHYGLGTVERFDGRWVQVRFTDRLADLDVSAAPLTSL